MENYKSKIYAIVLISEKTNTVSVHFDGFEDAYDAKDFSNYLMEELNIEDLNNPKNHTIH